MNHDHSNLNSELSPAKRALFAAMVNGMDASPVDSNVIRRLGAEIAPVSEYQDQLYQHNLLANSVAPGVHLYNETITIHRHGPLDAELLGRCFCEIVRRHEAWRTSFIEKDSQTFQRIHEPPQINFPMVDLRALPSDQRQCEAVRVATEDARRPFDLTQVPLFRGVLVRMEDEEYRLFLTLHQIILDGVSVYQVLLPELMMLYEAFSTNQPSPLPELPVQYPDYASWQRTSLTPDQSARQMAYWQKQLGGELPVIELPTDRPRPPVQTFHGAIEPFHLSPELSTALVTLSRRENITLFATLLAASCMLLSRYTGQKDIVVGTIAPMRKRMDIQKLLGYFLNPVVLRFDVSDDPSFRMMVARASATLADALAHDDVPFSTIARELQPAFDPSRHPLYQVQVSLEPPLPALRGWNLTPMDVESGGTKLDLYIVFDERPGGIIGRLQYNPNLFDRARMTRMAGHIATMLAAIVAQPELRLSEVPLLTSVESRQILTDWNSTAAEYPRHLCLHEVVAAQAQKTPDAVAVIFGEHALTYRELDVRANQLAHYLRKCDVKPGGYVAVCLKRSLEFAVASLAALKAGAACVPLDPKYPAERLTFMLEDVQAQVLLTQRGLPTGAVPAGTLILHLTLDLPIFSEEPSSTPENLTTPPDGAYVIYTSGSTGKPRGVLLSHRGIVNYAISAVKLFGLEPNDRMSQFCSVSFDVSIEELFSTWSSGAAVVLRDDDMSLAIPDFFDWIERQHITAVDLPTAYWHEWAHALPQLRQTTPAGLRLVIVGGDKASLDAYSAWTRFVGNKVRWINSYGPTETSISATAYIPDAHTTAYASSLPIGRPLPNTQVYVLDSHMNPVPVGVPGELYVGGDGVALGYLHHPELTTQKFIPDPFRSEPGARLYRTGDLARYRDDGQVEFIGRGDHQVKIRGYRVEPGEVESLLSKHPEIREAVVIALASGPGDKRLVCYVVPNNGHAPSAHSLRTFLNKQLPDYMVPSAFITVEAMPMTPNGKVNRRALPDVKPFGEDPIREDHAGPQDSLESQLKRIWEDTLGVGSIGVSENFFELGGHSLLAVRLMHRIEQAIGCRLPITMLFRAPTIRELGMLLREDRWSPSWSSLVAIQPNGSKAPFFCVHGVGGTVLRFRDLARHLGPDRPFYALQAQGLDGQCPPHTSVEDMARHYLREIRGVQFEGPYILGGYSFGGSVALEMAHLLAEQGEQPEVVVLLDTPVIHASKRSLFIKLMGLPARQQATYLSRKARAVGRRIRRSFDTMLLPPALKAVRASCYLAAAAYKPAAYAGRVVLFSAEEKSLASFADPQNGWGKYLDNLEVHEIAGHHGNIITEPNVRALAEALRSCLDCSESNRAVARFASSLS